MPNTYSRHIELESVLNFRDLGGYRTASGNSTAWRKLFRAGNLANINSNDMGRLRGELSLSVVIDLRSPFEIDPKYTQVLSASGIKYHNISLFGDKEEDGDNPQPDYNVSDMGEFYVRLIRQEKFGNRIASVLKLIAESIDSPLVFHCSVGKDRTGIIAAFILGLLDVADEDIVQDYCLTAQFITELQDAAKKDPNLGGQISSIPAFFWQATPATMHYFLDSLRREFGTAREYLENHGMDSFVSDRLRTALTE